MNKRNSLQLAARGVDRAGINKKKSRKSLSTRPALQTLRQSHAQSEAPPKIQNEALAQELFKVLSQTRPKLGEQAIMEINRQDPKSRPYAVISALVYHGLEACLEKASENGDEFMEDNLHLYAEQLKAQVVEVEERFTPKVKGEVKLIRSPFNQEQEYLSMYYCFLIQEQRQQKKRKEQFRAYAEAHFPLYLKSVQAHYHNQVATISKEAAEGYFLGLVEQFNEANSQAVREKQREVLEARLAMFEQVRMLNAADQHIQQAEQLCHVRQQEGRRRKRFEEFGAMGLLVNAFSIQKVIHGR